MNTELQKQIEERNRIWEAASQEERRVLAAKDVIERLQSGQFEAGADYSDERFWSEKDEADVQSIILSGQPCSQCAAGSLLLSQVAYSNRLTASEVSDFQNETETEADKYFGNLFSYYQAQLIEAAYENYSSSFPEVCNLCSRYRDRKERMIAIMQNIIDNNGTFIP